MLTYDLKHEASKQNFHALLWEITLIYSRHRQMLHTHKNHQLNAAKVKHLYNPYGIALFYVPSFTVHNTINKGITNQHVLAISHRP
jgi:hypothetical protein